MNGYNLMANAYRKAANDGILDKEQAEKSVRIFEFLATCDEEDAQIIYCSGAINSFMRSEINITIEEAREDGIIDETQAQTIKYMLYEHMTK